MSGRTDPGAVRAARPVKHSFSIAGHRTSISLEQAFWDALKRIAAREGITLASLVARIDRGRGQAGLSSAVRVFILHAAMAGQLGDERATDCTSDRTD